MTDKKQEKSDSKEIDQRKNTLPAEASAEFEKHAGKGQEGITADDMLIPRVRIVQSGSAERNKTKPEYIKEAKEGDILNTATRELFDGEKGIEVMLSMWRKTHVEWKTREAGGGFVADHGADYNLSQCKMNDKNQYVNEAGNHIVPTFEYLATWLKEDGSAQTAIISMSNTQLRTAKRLNTLISEWRLANSNGDGGSYNPPMAARTYMFTTVPQSNDKGSWYGWEIKIGRMTNDIPNGMELFHEKMELVENIKAGKVKVAEYTSDQSPEDSDEDDNAI